MSDDNSKKLGLMGLIAIVAGSMIGGGIFNLPQNMAAGAGAGAVMLAWVGISKRKVKSCVASGLSGSPRVKVCRVPSRSADHLKALSQPSGAVSPGRCAAERDVAGAGLAA